MNPVLRARDRFVDRHIGPDDSDVKAMLEAIRAKSLDALVEEAVPADIRMEGSLRMPAAASETEALERLRAIADKNVVKRSMIGQGYYDCITPAVIQRNILENPGWYTQYTPYQAEIAQGRMEALVNFQTMVSELTGLPLANASLLDESTAAAEAMAMAFAIARQKKRRFVVSPDCHPQTIAVLRTRAEPVGVNLVVEDPASASLDDCFAVLLQYPDTRGRLRSPKATIDRAHEAGALAIVATDLLALTLIEAPGTLGADIAVGSAQRFGVPLGAGGPHAAFLSTSEAHKRFVPGRIIGVSKDARGRPAYRLALQTREQHIRRDRATSNICTAQVLLAIMSAMYGVYHGPEGLARIARRVRGLTRVLRSGLQQAGYQLSEEEVFDTLSMDLEPSRARALADAAEAIGYNLRRYPEGLGISLDETTELADVERLLAAFGAENLDLERLAEDADAEYSEEHRRHSEFMTHEVFNTYRSEHELLRYMQSLQNRDLSLTSSMIPLGSCTMKLNATSEMLPISWPGFSKIHPFAPDHQQQGYTEMFTQLEDWLAEITGFAGVSLQPNAGSQGEYTGLLTIRAYHRSRGDEGRTVCLIPESAHGTNPASAVMAGMKVVGIRCDEAGNIDLEDLRAKANQHAAALAALMITYPSTHGVFETAIREICQVVHDHGGQVYLDGANLNAQVGLCRPGDYGADVCHLNLHKTFCIPHGGGGPGMGPIGVGAHLAPFLPGHPERSEAPSSAIGPVAAAPYGSPSILPISWMYMAMMGPDGLAQASRISILNANYMAERLRGAYDVLYTGRNGRVAHEFIIDLRPFKASGIEVDDVAKRLMDFGFHAPTMSWPVAGTMMVEPTESEAMVELDRFCDAMLAIRDEIEAVEQGRLPQDNNPLKMAPHTQHMVCATEWNHPYPREQAAFPRPWIRDAKFWPSVARVDNAYGDRNLMCTCPPVSAFTEG
ncbi:MAG: aminomethyl-transferring glycine dehydrogenase [Myxococcota bacterium]